MHSRRSCGIEYNNPNICPDTEGIRDNRKLETVYGELEKSSVNKKELIKSPGRAGAATGDIIYFHD